MSTRARCPAGARTGRRGSARRLVRQAPCTRPHRRRPRSAAGASRCSRRAGPHTRLRRRPLTPWGRPARSTPAAVASSSGRAAESVTSRPRGTAGRWRRRAGSLARGDPGLALDVAGKVVGADAGLGPSRAGGCDVHGAQLAGRVQPVDVHLADAAEQLGSLGDRVELDLLGRLLRPLDGRWLRQRNLPEVGLISHLGIYDGTGDHWTQPETGYTIYSRRGYTPASIRGVTWSHNRTRCSEGTCATCARKPG